MRAGEEFRGLTLQILTHLWKHMSAHLPSPLEGSPHPRPLPEDKPSPDNKKPLPQLCSGLEVPSNFYGFSLATLLAFRVLAPKDAASVAHMLFSLQGRWSWSKVSSFRKPEARCNSGFISSAPFNLSCLFLSFFFYYFFFFLHFRSFLIFFVFFVHFMYLFFAWFHLFYFNYTS